MHAKSKSILIILSAAFLIFCPLSAKATNQSVFIKNLKKGMNDYDVVTLQEYLKEDSKIYPEGKVTGNFDTATERAVKKFQKKNGIITTGIVGPLTRAKLNKILVARWTAKDFYLPPLSEWKTALARLPDIKIGYSYKYPALMGWTENYRQDGIGGNSPSYGTPYPMTNGHGFTFVVSVDTEGSDSYAARALRDDRPTGATGVDFTAEAWKALKNGSTLKGYERKNFGNHQVLSWSGSFKHDRGDYEIFGVYYLIPELKALVETFFDADPGHTKNILPIFEKFVASLEVYPIEVAQGGKVEIKNCQASPDLIEAAAWSDIVFTNKDNQPHNLTIWQKTTAEADNVPIKKVFLEANGTSTLAVNFVPWQQIYEYDCDVTKGNPKKIISPWTPAGHIYMPKIKAVAGNTVTYSDCQPNPFILSAAEADEITFINQDNKPHTLTYSRPNAETGKSYSQKIIMPANGSAKLKLTIPFAGNKSYPYRFICDKTGDYTTSLEINIQKKK